MANILRTIKYVIIIFILIFAVGGVFFVYNSIRGNVTNSETIKVNIDETVILKEVQDLSSLQVVNIIFQRDIEVELDLGSLQVAGLVLAENKRKTDVAVTGSVAAFVDLSKIQKDNIQLDSEKKSLTLTIPAPELGVVQIDADKSRTLRDDLTLLFQIENLNNNRRIELNELLNDQVVKQSEVALKDAACDSDILGKARDNAKSEVERLFLFSGLEEVNVTVEEPQGC